MFTFAGLGQLQLGAAHQLHLVHVVHVHAELLHPQRRVGHRRVDGQRAPAHVDVGQPLQAVERRNAEERRLQPAVDLLVAELAEDLVERDPRLVQGAGVGQHADHRRETRVQVGVQDERLGTELGGHAREPRPCPDAVVEHDAVHAGVLHHLAVLDREGIVPDHLLTRHHLEAVLHEGVAELLLELRVDRLQVLLQELAAVAEGEYSDLDLPLHGHPPQLSLTLYFNGCPALRARPPMFPLYSQPRSPCFLDMSNHTARRSTSPLTMVW